MYQYHLWNWPKVVIGPCFRKSYRGSLLRETLDVENEGRSNFGLTYEILYREVVLFFLSGLKSRIVLFSQILVGKTY